MTKVNVGDKVKCSVGCYISIKEGETCIVAEVLDSTRFKGKDTQSGGHYNMKDFELVKRSEVNQFEAGDVVRIIGNTSNHSFKIGDDVRITGWNTKGGYYTSDSGCGDFYAADCEEIIKIAPTQYKFKKGDQVTPVHDFMGIDPGPGVALSYAESDGIMFGRVYTIHSADNSIVLKNQGSGLYLNPLQFRLATETEAIAEDLDLNVPCAEEAPLPVQEDTDMYPETVTTGTPAQLKVETISYVNGKPITNYSVEEQASLIMDVENRITALKGIKAKSKAINAEIAKFQAFLKDAVALFDSLIAD